MPSRACLPAYAMSGTKMPYAPTVGTSTRSRPPSGSVRPASCMLLRYATLCTGLRRSCYARPGPDLVPRYNVRVGPKRDADARVQLRRAISVPAPSGPR
eukprot:1854430-Rhodomonas_salina.3